MKQFTFEELPKVIGKLYDKLDRIEKILQAKTLVIGAEEDLLTIEEASTFLNLSVATIYTKVSKNEIPVNKQGKRLYFYKSELAAWIKEGRIKTITEIYKDIEVKNTTVTKKRPSAK